MHYHSFPVSLHLCCLLLMACSLLVRSQELPPAVQANLDDWQSRKFGLMMHWGPYSQWGVVESWSICSEDEPWCSRNGRNYVEYVAEYQKLPRTFNPVRFNPEKWAEAARAAGMRYVVFTTKHHDGFCMFDSPGTDYKITDPSCPFHSHPRADVTRALFDAFRKNDFLIGAYFSKPDWHSPDYWAPEWATPDRNVNYDPARYPQRWQRFKEYTSTQIEKLMRDYGRIDILWLDGGWVRPQASITDDIRAWAGMKPYDQDIDMAAIAAMARRQQPGLIMVDRTVTGPYENYRTPEQQVPGQPLDYPWETCMTMGNAWSFNPHDHYKSPRQLIHLLVDIVAKGGNFLLNVGPDANGEWPEAVYERLKSLGQWMAVNQAAIYDTHPLAPYKSGNICLTQSKTGRRFAIYLGAETEETLPETVALPMLPGKAPQKLRLLGYVKDLSWKRTEHGIRIHVPDFVRQQPPCQDAWVFEYIE